MGLALANQRKFTRSGGTDAEVREAPIYQTWYVRFVAIFALLCLATVGSVWFSSSIDSQVKITVSVLVIALVAAFWLFGQWHLITSDLHAIGYLAFNLVCVAIGIRLYDGTALLLFAAYWMAFAYLHTKPAIIYTVFLTIASQWGFGTFDGGIGWNLETLIFACILAVIIGMSTMMASYIEAFQREAEKNRALLGELQRAQASLIEREREAGVESERQRLAGEIHDTIAQHFASVITNLNAATELNKSRPTEAREHVAHAMQAAQEGITDSRSLLSTMQPVVTEGRTLDDVLQSIASAPYPGTGPEVHFVSDGEPASIGRVRESLLVRGLQEALRNARKHAEASEIKVTLTWLENEVLLDVSDNGIGFDPDSVTPRHDGFRVGLANMASRIEESGGTFVLDSAPHEGTAITISFLTGDDA